MNDVLSTVQAEAWEWTKQNFPGQLPWQPLLGIQEELGELSHAFLKAAQNIRGTREEHHAAIVDAVGDLQIFLVNFCSHLGIDASDALWKTWQQVRQRDWKADPKAGGERPGDVPIRPPADVLPSPATDTVEPGQPGTGAAVGDERFWASKFERAGFEVGALVTEKNRAYGDSFNVSGQFVGLLWPDGVPPESYADMLAFVRSFDKMKRIATDPGYGGEDPHRDLVGYAILNYVRRQAARG